ncbi:MAG: EamA family transporter [Steroidobacterales bacterium]
MPVHAVYIVLFAALMHAGWNAIVKGGGDKLLSAVMITSAAAAIAALVLPFLAQPAPASWPFIAGSVALQILYYALLAAAYRGGDLSHAYPIMRGTAPLIVAAVSAWLIGEAVTVARWLGIGLICAGVLGLAAHRPARTAHGGHAERHRSVTALALANAVVIASYTVIDGLGVRRSGAPVAYTLWIFLLTGIELQLWARIRRRRELGAYLRGQWPQGLAGGAGTVLSYSLALWAMTVAPVALVAALRETSILFATVISALVLKERVTLQRAGCIGLIVAGAWALRLA